MSVMYKYVVAAISAIVALATLVTSLVIIDKVDFHNKYREYDIARGKPVSINGLFPHQIDFIEFWDSLSCTGRSIVTYSIALQTVAPILERSIQTDCSFYPISSVAVVSVLSALLILSTAITILVLPGITVLLAIPTVAVVAGLLIVHQGMPPVMDAPLIPHAVNATISGSQVTVTYQSSQDCLLYLKSGSQLITGVESFPSSVGLWVILGSVAIGITYTFVLVITLRRIRSRPIPKSVEKEPLNSQFTIGDDDSAPLAGGVEFDSSTIDSLPSLPAPPPTQKARNVSFSLITSVIDASTDTSGLADPSGTADPSCSVDPCCSTDASSSVVPSCSVDPFGTAGASNSISASSRDMHPVDTDVSVSTPGAGDVNTDTSVSNSSNGAAKSSTDVAESGTDVAESSTDTAKSSTDVADSSIGAAKASTDATKSSTGVENASNTEKDKE